MQKTPKAGRWWHSFVSMSRLQIWGSSHTQSRQGNEVLLRIRVCGVTVFLDQYFPKISLVLLTQDLETRIPEQGWIFDLLSAQLPPSLPVPNKFSGSEWRAEVIPAVILTWKSRESISCAKLWFLRFWWSYNAAVSHKWERYEMEAYPSP